MMSNKKNVLILGGLGLIGSAIAKKMVKDYNIFIADKKNNVNENNNISFHKLDINNAQDLSNLMIQIKPKIIINGVNIATICSKNPEEGLKKIIKFYYNLYQTFTKLDSDLCYIQLGTTGSGGLGFNIPFTHGDKIENMPIIYKSAFAGISTSMLTLLSRSFNNEIRVCEVKPGLSIFKSDIEHEMVDNTNLVTLDGGESGHYTYNEVALLTSFMGFTTDDTIVNRVVELVAGKKNLHRHCIYDIVESTNSAIINEKNSDKRKLANLLSRMKKISTDKSIIATGNLGPPSITRDLILSSVVIRHGKCSEDEFKEIIKKDPTLKYIKKTQADLYDYLVTELNYSNFCNLPNNDKEPWKNVRATLGKYKK